MSAERVGRRTVAFYLLTSCVNFATAALAGGLLALGILAGGGSLAFTAGPAIAAALVIAGVLALPRLLDARAGRRTRQAGAGRAGRALAWLRGALSAGVRDAVMLARTGNPQIVGGADRLHGARRRGARRGVRGARRRSRRSACCCSPTSSASSATSSRCPAASAAPTAA